LKLSAAFFTSSAIPDVAIVVVGLLVNKWFSKNQFKSMGHMPVHAKVPLWHLPRTNRLYVIPDNVVGIMARISRFFGLVSESGFKGLKDC
jgi:hypothetical protein